MILHALGWVLVWWATWGCVIGIVDGENKMIIGGAYLGTIGIILITLS